MIDRLRYLLCLFVLITGQAQATPEIQTWTTQNGARVLFVHNDALPMLDVRIEFDAGSARDGDKAGLASLTNGLLVEGSDGVDASTMAERFESVGAEISLDSLRDMAYVNLRTLTDEEYMSVALENLRLTLTAPDFIERAFERDLASMKVSARAAKQDPSSVASRKFFEAVYGEHPYATPVGGDEESLARIDRKDVQAFYERYYVASNALIVMVGDIDPDAARTIANDLMSGLTKGEKPASLPPAPTLDDDETVIIDFPSSQTHILMGQVGMKRGDDDYFALYMANHPLGGSGFASRLVDTIREEHGLAYSVYSYFSPMRESGPFTLGMQTRSDQTDKALELLRDELVGYIEEGPTEEEITSSKGNVIGSFPLNLDSNKKLLGYLAMIGFYDLPLSYLDDFRGNIEAVTREDMMRAFEERIDPDRMVTVIVGRQG